MLDERVQDLWTYNPADLGPIQKDIKDIAEILRGSATVMADQGVPWQEIAQTVQDEYMHCVDDLINQQGDPALRAALEGVRDAAVAAAAELDAWAEEEAQAQMMEAWAQAEEEAAWEQRAQGAMGCADMQDVAGRAMKVGVLLSPDGPEKILCAPFRAAADPAAVCRALVGAHRGQGAWGDGREAHATGGEALCIDLGAFGEKLSSTPAPPAPRGGPGAGP